MWNMFIILLLCFKYSLILVSCRTCGLVPGSTLGYSNYQYFRALFLPYRLVLSCTLPWWKPVNGSEPCISLNQWQRSWPDFPNTVSWALMVRTTFFWSHQRHLWGLLNNSLLRALLFPEALPRNLLKAMNKLRGTQIEDMWAVWYLYFI